MYLYGVVCKFKFFMANINCLNARVRGTHVVASFFKLHLLKMKKITIQVGLQHLQGGAARVAKLKPYNYALLVFNHF